MLLAEGGSLLDTNPATILWAWVCFGITFFALRKVAWPMLAKKMEERELRIREGLDKAEEYEKKAREIMTRQEALLDEARAESQKIVAESRRSAEHMKQEALSLAQKEIAAEKERAKREISLERAKAVDELRKAAVDMTLEAAGRVLGRELTGADQRRLAGEVLSQVEVLR